VTWAPLAVVPSPKFHSYPVIWPTLAEEPVALKVMAWFTAPVVGALMAAATACPIWMVCVAVALPP
jgi:hypothetical protein